MASRLGLGRIIDWAKNADQEELRYVTKRLVEIVTERAKQVDRADAQGKVKRTRKAKPPVAVVHTDESAHLDAPKPEKAASA